jgi:hypothetical protein
MNRRMLSWAGLLVLAFLMIGTVSGCAHQRESFTWPWAKRGGTALAEPPLDQAAREAPRSVRSAGSEPRSSSLDQPEMHQARSRDGESFDFDAFRD